MANLGGGKNPATPATGSSAGGASSLGALNDVTLEAVSSRSDGELFVWSATSSQWINQTAAEAGIGTSDADAIHVNSSGEISALSSVAPSSGMLFIVEDAIQNAKYKVTAADILALGAATDTDAFHVNSSGEIASLASVTGGLSTAEVFVVEDASSNQKKKASIAEIISLITHNDTAAFHKTTSGEIASLSSVSVVDGSLSTAMKFVVEDGTSNQKRLATAADILSLGVAGTDTAAFHKTSSGEIAGLSSLAASTTMMFVVEDGTSNQKKKVTGADVVALVGSVSTLYPSSGIQKQENFSGKSSLIFADAESTVGWFITDGIANPRQNSSYKQTGSYSMELWWDLDPNNDTVLAAGGFTSSVTVDASGYKYLTVPVAALGVGSNNVKGPHGYFELVASSGTSTITPHSTVQFRDQWTETSAGQGEFHNIYLPLKNSSVKSVWFRQIAGGITNGHLTLAIDRMEFVPTNAAQEAMVDTGGVLIEPSFSSTVGIEEYAPDTRTAVDLRDKIRTINTFRGHKHMRDYYGSDFEQGSSAYDMSERFQSLIEKLGDGQTLEFTPDAQYWFNDKWRGSTIGTVLLRNNDLKLAFNGAKLLVGSSHGSTTGNSLFYVTGRGIEMYDPFVYGPMTCRTSSNIYGNNASYNSSTNPTAWRATGTTSTGSSYIDLQSSDATATTKITQEIWKGRQIDGSITGTINLGGSGISASLGFVSISGGSGTMLVKRASDSYPESAGLMHGASVATDYTWKYWPADLGNGATIVVSNQSGVGVSQRINYINVQGARDNHFTDNAHMFEINSALNTVLRRAHVFNSFGDALKVDGRAYNTLCEDFYFEAIGRQGYADVRSIQTTVQRGKIINAGRHNVDIESFSTGQFVTNPTLRDLFLVGGRLGGLSMDNAHLVIRPRVTDILFEKMHYAVEWFVGGGVDATIDNLVARQHIDRETGAGTNQSWASFHGTRMNVSNIFAEGDQGQVIIEDGGAGINVGNYNRYRNIHAAWVKVNTQTNYTLDGVRGVEVQDSIYTQKSTFSYPIHLNALTSNAFFSDVHMGDWQYGKFKQNFGTIPIGQAQRFYGGLYMHDESIKDYGGRSWDHRTRSKPGGRHASISSSAASKTYTVDFSDAQYVKTDITQPTAGTFSASDTGTGGTLNAVTTYYYRHSALHERGGHPSVITSSGMAEVSVTTSGSSNDRRVRLSVSGLNNEGLLGSSFIYSVRGLRFWRGTTSSTYDRYVDIRLDQTDQRALMFGHWSIWASTNAIEVHDNGASVTFTSSQAQIGYPSGSFTWITTNVPDHATDYTGMEQDSLYAILPSIESTGSIGGVRISNKSPIGFDVTWDSSFGSTFTLTYELVGINS